MSSTSKSQRSPPSPGAPLHDQDSNQSDEPAHRSAQPASGGDRCNPTSGTITKGPSSQADHGATTRHLSLAGSQKTSGSGGVLGLPNALDPFLFDNCFDLDQLGAKDDLTSSALDLDTLNWITNNNFDLGVEYFDANPVQCYDPLQGDQFGLDLGLSYTQPEEDGKLQNKVESNFGLGIGLDPSLLLPTESCDSQPLDLNYWDSTSQVPSQLDDTTLGFSALPGGSSLMPDISQYLPSTLPQSIYPDPLAPLYPNYPYLPFTTQQYSSSYTQNAPISTEYDDVTKRQAVQPVKKQKRSYVNTSDSEVDPSIIRRPREDRRVRSIASPPTTRNHSLVSEDESLSKPVKETFVTPGQKPKKCEDKPWVRINNTTKGETTRTARINQHAEEGRKYKTKDLPHGDWNSKRYSFEYSKNNGMHEFKKRTMSARQVHEYITQYPGDELRIWIQPVASDSARRYASASHSHCRFEKCPMRKYTGKGTAEVGNYRVAFDEKHKTYGPGVVDPYDCVAYAHLYCMERFLDFAYICKVADVRVDQRVSMEKEPKGHFASAFGTKHYHEAALAKRFIDAASKGRLADTPEFANYPVHEQYARGAPKPHDRTLIFALYSMNMKHRARSQMKQFILQRKVRPGSFPVHRGDLEVKLVDKKIERLPAFKEFLKEGPKKNFDYAAYYDQFHPEINKRIADCMRLRAQFIAEDKKQGTTRRSRTRRQSTGYGSDEEVKVISKRSKKRRSVDVESEDEGSSPRKRPRRRKSVHGRYHDIEEIQQVPRSHAEPRPSREGLRQKQRIDYAEPQNHSLVLDVPSLNDTAKAAVPSYQQPTQTLDVRKESCSDLFPANNDNAWENVDVQTLDASEAVLTDEQIDQLLNAAYRRKSSTLSNGPTISALRSPLRLRDGVVPRKASFHPQPVTQSKEFRLDDPPVRVANGQDGAQRTIRRSMRFAGNGAGRAFGYQAL